MVRFSNCTAAGLRVAGIVPQRSIPINMERSLKKKTELFESLIRNVKHCSELLGITLVMCGGSWGPMKPVLLWGMAVWMRWVTTGRGDD